MVFYILFEFSKREVNYINIALKYLLLEATSKNFNKEKVLFKFFIRS